MREIKFRIWDNKLKQFNYFDIFSTHGNIPNDCKNNIQQFTGLLDKNGREIYDKDILKGITPFYSTDLSINSPIGYEDCFMICEYEGDSARFKLKDISKKGYGGWDLHEGMVDRIEIIGNIFESPDLLK